MMSHDDEKISSLYRELGKPAPPDQLDDAILSASRKAVGKSPGKAPFSGAWPAAASVAAIVVIALILVPVLREQSPESTPEPYSAEKNALQNLEYEVLPDLDPDAAAPNSRAYAPPPASEQTISRNPALLTEQEVFAIEPTEKSRSRMEAGDSAPFAVLTPEMWEVKIAQLIDQGERELARAELDRLKAHFPEHTINFNLARKLGDQNE
jgi:hypothetical protein